MILPSQKGSKGKGRPLLPPWHSLCDLTRPQPHDSGSSVGCGVMLLEALFRDIDTGLGRTPKLAVSAPRESKGLGMFAGLKYVASLAANWLMTLDAVGNGCGCPLPRQGVPRPTQVRRRNLPTWQVVENACCQLTLRTRQKAGIRLEDGFKPP
jgi:hypothetical protein